MQYANNLKLYRVKGFFVSEFYLLASNKKEARKEAKKSLSFRVEEVVELQEEETAIG